MTNNNLELPTPYIKFFEQFKDIDTLEVSQWKTPHLLAHIARRYKEYYNIDFTFRMNASAPSKAYECIQIAKLKQMISSDPQIIKNYIDWIFDKKIIERKKRITTLAIFCDVSLINEYKWQIIDNQIDRKTPLPKNLLTIAQYIDDTIQSYGDLAFIRQSSDLMPGMKNMFDELQKAGLDIRMLEKIK